MEQQFSGAPQRDPKLERAARTAQATQDEKLLTLVQTGKIRNFPIILFDSAYWQGLLTWLRDTMLAEGKIGAPDLDLITLCDSPQEVCELIRTAMVEGGWCEEKEAAARNETQRVYKPV